MIRPILSIIHQNINSPSWRERRHFELLLGPRSTLQWAALYWVLSKNSKWRRFTRWRIVGKQWAIICRRSWWKSKTLDIRTDGEVIILLKCHKIQVFPRSNRLLEFHRHINMKQARDYTYFKINRITQQYVGELWNFNLLEHGLFSSSYQFTPQR